MMLIKMFGFKFKISPPILNINKNKKKITKLKNIKVFYHMQEVLWVCD